MMRMLLTGVLLSILVALPAQATAYNYSTSIDLSSPSVSYDYLTFALPASQPSFDLAVGDTLSGTITFDQAVTFTSTEPFLMAQSLMLTLTGSPGVTIGSTQSAGATVSSGTLTEVSNPSTASGTGSLFVPVEGSPALTNNSVTITGFTYFLSVTSESATGVSYTPSELTIMSPNAEVSIAPEPSTWAMLLISLASMGVCARPIFRRTELA
jgi:hypothetical protein